MKSVNIVGKGLFGAFLSDLFLKQGIVQNDLSDDVILAVPISAYKEVAEKHKGKHLINVCSVQEDSNNICDQYSVHVTGIHPLFGPRSPQEGRTAIVTKKCETSDQIIEVFKKCGSDILTHLEDGRRIDGALHDQMMALTHGATLEIAEKLQPIVDAAGWIPASCLPASFKRVQDVVAQFTDMSAGTAESIRSNKYI